MGFVSSTWLQSIAVRAVALSEPRNMRCVRGVSIWAVSCLCLLGTATAASANTVFNMGSGLTSNASVGSASLSVSSGGFTITVHGYDSPGNGDHTLYFKNQAGDEVGIGLVGTTNNELTLKKSSGSNVVANYLQIDVSQVYQAFTTATFEIESMTNGEKFDLYGSNTAGTLAAATKIINGKTDAELEGVNSIPALGSYKYLFLSVTPQSGKSHLSDNILLGANFEVTGPSFADPAPEPSTIRMLGSAALVGFCALRKQRREFWRRGSAFLRARS